MIPMAISHKMTRLTIKVLIVTMRLKISLMLKKNSFLNFFKNILIVSLTF